MRDTTAKGSLSEAKILAKLLEHGWEVLLPWRRMRRYDFVIERNGRFFKVQCKTGKLSQDKAYVAFATCNVNGTSQVRRSYVGEIDYFAVYCPDNDMAYLVPLSDDLGLAGCKLRILPPKNNQTSRIRLAEDYQL
jgi:hypothetical protein